MLSVSCRNLSILQEECSDAAPSYPWGSSITRPLLRTHLAEEEEHIVKIVRDIDAQAVIQYTISKPPALIFIVGYYEENLFLIHDDHLCDEVHCIRYIYLKQFFTHGGQSRRLSVLGPSGAAEVALVPAVP